MLQPEDRGAVVRYNYYSVLAALNDCIGAIGQRDWGKALAVWIDWLRQDRSPWIEFWRRRR
jgi:hypothetical protein